MESLIILDYSTGRVAILPCEKDENCEEIAQEWAEKNQTSLSDCKWMGWSGEISDERKDNGNETT